MHAAFKFFQKEVFQNTQYAPLLLCTISRSEEERVFKRNTIYAYALYSPLQASSLASGQSYSCSSVMLIEITCFLKVSDQPVSLEMNIPFHCTFNSSRSEANSVTKFLISMIYISTYISTQPKRRGWLTAYLRINPTDKNIAQSTPTMDDISLVFIAEPLNNHS